MAVSFKTLAFGILVFCCECYADLPISGAYVVTGEGLDGSPYLPSLSLLKEENGKLTKTSLTSPNSNAIREEKIVGDSLIYEKLSKVNSAVSNSTASNDNIINKNSLPIGPSSQDLGEPQSISAQSAANTRETNAVTDSVNDRIDNKINNPATEINSQLNSEKKAVDKTDVTTTVNSGVSGEVIKEGDVQSSVGNKATLIRTNGISDNGNNSYIEEHGVSPAKETTKTTTKPTRRLSPTHRRKSNRKYHSSSNEEEIVTRIVPDDELSPNPIRVSHRFRPSRVHPKTSALLFSSDGLNIHESTNQTTESTMDSDVSQLMEDLNLADHNHASKVISDPHITSDMLHKNGLESKLESSQDSSSEGNTSIANIKQVVDLNPSHSNIEHKSGLNHNHISSHYRPEAHHHNVQSQYQHRQTFSPHNLHHIKHSRNHTHSANTTSSANIIKLENTEETIQTGESAMGSSEVNHLLKDFNVAAHSHNSEVIIDPNITPDMIHQSPLLSKENHSDNTNIPHSEGEQKIVSSHNLHKSSHYRPGAHNHYAQAQHQHRHTFSPHISQHKTHTGDINSTTSSNLNKQDNTDETAKPTPDMLHLEELPHSNADPKNESNQNHHKYSHYRPKAHHYNAHSQNQHKHAFSPHTPNNKKHYGNINNNTISANASTSNSSSISSGHHKYTSHHRNLNSHRYIHKNSHENHNLTSLNSTTGSKSSSNNHENGTSTTVVPNSKHHRYNFKTHPLSLKTKHISSFKLNNSTNTSLTNQKNENSINVSTVVAHTTGIYERFRHHQRTSSYAHSSVAKNNSDLHKVNQTVLSDSHKTQTESSNMESDGEIYSSPTTSVYDRFRHRQHMHKNTTLEPSLHQTKHEDNENDSTTHRAATNIYDRFSKNRPHMHIKPKQETKHLDHSDSQIEADLETVKHQTVINSSRTNNADVPATTSIYERFRSNRPRMHMKPKHEPEQKHFGHNETILESRKHQKENDSSKPENQVDVPPVKSIYERFRKNRPHMHISSQSQTKSINKVDTHDEAKVESNSLQMKNESSEGTDLSTLPGINEELNNKHQHIQSHSHPNLYNKNRHKIHLRPNHHEHLNHKEDDTDVEKQIEAANVRVETHDSNQGDADSEGKVLEENISDIHHKNEHHRRLHHKHYYTNPIHTAEETNDDQAKQDASGERYMSPVYYNGHKKHIRKYVKPDISAEHRLSHQHITRDQTELTNPDDSGERYIPPQKYNDQKKYVNPDFLAENRKSHQQFQDQGELINPDDSGERYIPPLYNNEDVKTTVPNYSGKRYMLPQSHNEGRMVENQDSNDSGERYVSPQDNIKRFKPTSLGKLYSHHAVSHKRIPYHRTPHILPENDQGNEDIAQNSQDNGQFLRHYTENLPSSDLERQGFRMDDAGEHVQLLKRKGRDNGSSNRRLNETDVLKKDINADQKLEEQKESPNLFSTDEEDDESLFETYGPANEAFFDIGEIDQPTERTVEKVTVTLPKSFTDEESNKTQKIPVHNQTSESKDNIYNPEQGGLADPIQLAHMQEYIDQRTDTSEPELVTVDPDHWYGIAEGETKNNKKAANNDNNKTHAPETPTLETRFNVDEDNKDNKTIVATSKNTTEKKIEGNLNITINSTKILNNTKNENTTGNKATNEVTLKNKGFKNDKEENKSNETETDKKNKTTIINEKPMNSATEETLKRKSKGENKTPMNSSSAKPKESKNNEKSESNTTSEVFSQKKVNDTSVQTASEKGNNTTIETDLKQRDHTIIDATTENRKGNDKTTVNTTSKNKNNSTSAEIASKKGDDEVTSATMVKTTLKNENNTTNLKIASKTGTAEETDLKKKNISPGETDPKKENNTTTQKIDTTKKGINITTAEPAKQNDTTTVATTVKTTASLEITPTTSLMSPTVSSIQTDESKMKSKHNEQLENPSPTQEPQKEESTDQNITTKNIQVIKQGPITENNNSKALTGKNKDGENQETNTEHVTVGNKSTVVLNLDNPEEGGTEETIMVTKQASNDSENATTGQNAEKPAENFNTKELPANKTNVSKPDTTKIIMVDTAKNPSTAINTEKNNENNTEKSKDNVFVGSKATVIFNTEFEDDDDDDIEPEIKTEEVDLNIKPTEKVIEVNDKDSNTQIYKIKRKPSRNNHTGSHIPVIHKFIFGGRSNLTIEVKIKNESVYVPANVIIRIGSNNLHFNWSSNAQTKYGISLNLTAKNESSYYEIDRLQLYLVKAGNVSVWTKNVTIQPNDDEDADHVLTIAVAEDVQVVFSSDAFLKMHNHQNIEEGEAEAEERDHQQRIYNVEITVGVLLAALLVIIVIIVVVKNWRMRVIKRNNKVPAVQESRI